MSISSIDSEKVDEIKAESSTADDTGAKPPESMLEAVMASVAVEEEKVESTPSPDVETEEEGVIEADVEAEAEIPPFHEHPRWKQITGENRELKERVKVIDELEGYIHESGLEMTDVDQGIALMQMLKHNPEKALETLGPMMQQLQQFNGQGDLPEDLQSAVDSGRISEDYARELAKTQARSEFYQNQVVQVERNTEAEREHTAQENQTKIKSTVMTWEEDWKAKDPDFDKKHPRVRDRVIVLTMEQGPPTTPEAALALANRAKKEVDNELKTLIPPKTPSRTVTGGSSVNTAPEPKSLLEAVKLANSGA